MKHFLVFNYGSSTLKYAYFEDLKELYRSVLKVSKEEDVEGAVKKILNTVEKVDVIVHRVVHGKDLDSPLFIDREGLQILKELVAFNPLHNALAIIGVEVCLKDLADVPQYAVFDTFFFKHLPFTSKAYALPTRLYKEGIRRYGFHGISYSYLLKETAKLMGKSTDELSAIMLHLGSGASACAVYKGKPIDTSMGMTPLEGLVMLTRAGDLDPGVVLELLKKSNTLQDLERFLYRECGIKGLTHTEDMRQLIQNAREGSRIAKRALDLYIHRIKKYIGAYYVLLEELDALVFSGGVGENSPEVRSLVCNGLEKLGVIIEEEMNIKNEPYINSKKSKVKVLVIKTDEELEMVRQVQQALKV